MKLSAGIAAALALLVAGCGSDKQAQQPAVTGPQPLARPDYIAQADEVCRLGNRRLRPLIERLVRLDNSDQPVAFRMSGYRRTFHSVGLAYQELVSGLQEIPPPADGDSSPIQMIRLFDMLTLHLDRLQAAISAGSGVQAHRAVSRINRTVVKIGGIATGYGFEVCGVIPRAEGQEESGGPFPQPKLT